MPLDDKTRDDDEIPVSDIITPKMRAAMVKAWMNCPTKNVETRCVAIFIAGMQALDPDE
jgi:hypothetical protein